MWCFIHRLLDDDHPHIADAIEQLAKPDRFEETVRLLALHGVEVRPDRRGWLELMQSAAENVLTPNERDYIANGTIAADSRPSFQRRIDLRDSGACPFCENKHPVTGESHPLQDEDGFKAGWRAHRDKEFTKRTCVEGGVRHEHDESEIHVSNGIRVARCGGWLAYMGHPEHSDEEIRFSHVVHDNGCLYAAQVEVVKLHEATKRRRHKA